jgi:hypothetical protein
VEIKRIAIVNQPRQKISEILISINKLGVVVSTCQSSQLDEGLGMRIVVGCKNMRP